MKKLKVLVTFLFVYLLINSANIYAYSQDIDILKHMNILDGYSDGELKLNKEVSRAEFAKMAVMASKFSGEINKSLDKTSFTDLTNEHWAYPYIEVAYDKNIICGYDDGTFRPNQCISYEESLAIILRMIGYEELDNNESWAETQVDMAEKIGLVDSIECNIGQNMTRGDLSKLIKNMLLCKNNSEKYYIETLGYIVFDNTEIIAIDNNDFVLTNNGIYKTNSKTSADLIGKKGYLILNQNQEIICFVVDDSNTGEKPVAENVDTTYDGPYTVESKNWIKIFKGKEDFKEVIRNGKKSTVDDVEMYDILYYQKSSDKLLVYNNKFTGVYQSVTPNKDRPEEVTVSGKSYKIDSVVAFSKLYAGGKYKVGDSITLLLGKDGKVVDVIDSSLIDVVGYITDAGVKNFTISGQTTKNYYISVQFADGNNVEYITKKLYKKNKNQIVKITFENKYAKITQITASYNLNGLFDLENKTFGKDNISENIQILDIYSTDVNSLSLYKVIKPERINNVNISSEKVLYCERNDNGKITMLILNNVTGDMIKYGICTKASKTNNGFDSIKASYSYDISGTVYNLNTSNKIYGVEKGVPAMFVTSDGKSIETMSSLFAIRGDLNSIDVTNVVIDDKSYPISPNVCVYVNNYYGTYLTMTMKDLAENSEKYNICAYHDKGANYGGCIRIIVVSEK